MEKWDLDAAILALSFNLVPVVGLPHSGASAFIPGPDPGVSRPTSIAQNEVVRALVQHKANVHTEKMNNVIVSRISLTTV